VLPSTSSFLADGRLERTRLSPLVSAFIGLIAAFFLFQGISTIVLLALLLNTGLSLQDILNDLASVLSANPGTVLISNTVGQVFGLLLPALWFARLHSSTWKSFLRLRMANPRFLFLSILALIALIPIVQWTGSVSDSLPWPDWIRELEQAQMDLIEGVLTHDFSLVFSISMLALTPAICEEVLFRGFVQRQAERALGAWRGIAFSGIIFGLYHLRLTQAIPLSILGVFMAYVTWRSRSLLPAMLIHLANNSFAAVMGKMASSESSNVDLESFTFPLTIVIPAAMILAGTLWFMHNGEAENRTDDGGDPTVASLPSDQNELREATP